MSDLRTTIEIGSGLSDYEVEIEVEYTVHRGCAQTQTQPGEDDSIEITEVRVVHGGMTYGAPWLLDLLADDEEITSLCMLDAIEERQAQAEYRAEARREALMLGDA